MPCLQLNLTFALNFNKIFSNSSSRLGGIQVTFKKQYNMANAINWFEIPAADFTRAKKFYETILGIEITEMPFPHGQYGMFPADMQNGGVGGGLIQSEGFNPSQDGTVVYLNGGEDLSTPLAKIEAAGGTIIMPKRPSGQTGLWHTLQTRKETGLHYTL